jgi:putative peptidoglycan lipid II flippase
VNVVAAFVNVGAALAYVGPLTLGLRGMALAHATSYVVGACLLLLLLRRRLGPIGGALIARTVAKTSLAAVVSALAALVVTELWEAPTDASVSAQAARVGVAIVVGVLVFLGSALILRIGEVDDVRKVVLRRFRG